MKKSDALKSITKLRTAFKDDEESLKLLDILKSKLAYFEDDDSDNREITESELVIPAELKAVVKGYAIFADGACRGNPGPGSYGLLIQNELGEIILKSSGVEVPTTNNKMELQGVITGLQGLFDKFQENGFSESHLPIFVYSDSKYVVDGISSWVPGWKSRGWKKADNKDPENLTFWKELDQLKSGFSNIKFIWVKGHAGHPQNEMCDKMANAALDEAGF